MVRTRAGLAALLAGLALAVVACGGGGAATPALTKAPATTPTIAAAPVEPSAIITCDVIPGTDVSAVSPFSIPLESVTPGSSVPGQCVYQFHKDGEYAAIKIDILPFASHDEAVAALQSHSQAIRDGYGIEPEAIAGLGDLAAWSAGNVEDAGIDVVTGPWFIDVNLDSQGGKVPDAARRSTAIALAKLALSRIP